MDRKGRAADVGMEMAAMRAQLPYIANYMKDLSTFKQDQLLAAEREKQGMAKQIQERLGQSALTAEAMARATATQQDAATRFAGLGMQRRFG